MVHSGKPSCLPSVFTHLPALPLLSSILEYNTAIFGSLIQVVLPVACIIVRKGEVRFLSTKFTFKYLISI